ncbi:MAG: hypothetical protein AAGE84_00580 [Cyanobacteria bacterium P01_G01_bin.39]
MFEFIGIARDNFAVICANDIANNKDCTEELFSMALGDEQPSIVDQNVLAALVTSEIKNINANKKYTFARQCYADANYGNKYNCIKEYRSPTSYQVNLLQLLEKHK